VAAWVVCVIVAVGRYSGIVLLALLVTLAFHAPCVSNGLHQTSVGPVFQLYHGGVMQSTCYFLG
jgi:hypothetical protein